MIRRFLLPAFLVLAVVFAVAQANKPVSVDVPVLPTEKDQFGGRPGSFHFETNEQTMANAADLKRAFEALDRLDVLANGKGDVDRAKLAQDLLLVRAFATNVHLARTSSAGESAKEVEARLTGAKGKFMCGACHGSGMMHGMMRSQAKRSRSVREDQLDTTG